MKRKEEQLKERDKEREKELKKLNIEALIEEEQKEKKLSLPTKIDLMPNKAGSQYQRNRRFETMFFLSSLRVIQ